MGGTDAAGTVQEHRWHHELARSSALLSNLRAWLSVGAVTASELVGKHALAVSLFRQETRLQEALTELGTVRNFVDNPAGILGNPATKHGEIAEVLEVSSRNARALLQGLRPDARLDANRFGPVDYHLGQTAVQSKFINGVTRNMSHVLRHLEDNPEFGRGGSVYVIPLDHYEVVRAVSSGARPAGLSDRTIRAILSRTERLEKLSGRSFSDIVWPSEANYGDVMKGRIGIILEKRATDLKRLNDELNDAIRKRHAPSVLAGFRAAAVAGAFAGASAFVAGVHAKWRLGKNPLRGEFDADDWRDVGVAGGSAAGGGVISGFAFYALTNFVRTPAPLAGAYVAAGASVLSLADSWRSGDISADEFVELAPLACIDTAVVLLATLAAQTLIPVPLAGLVLGALAAQICLRFLPDEQEHRAALEEFRRYLKDARTRIADASAEVLRIITDEYDALGDLTDVAFDSGRNAALQLAASVELGHAYGLGDDELLHDSDDVVKFMLE